MFDVREMGRMEVFWRTVKWGQNLVLFNESDGHDEVIGGVRETKRGIDASAKTVTYDTGRSQKGFATVADAKAFVESLRPWELYGAQGVTVDPEVRPALDSASTDTTGTPD